MAGVIKVFKGSETTAAFTKVGLYPTRTPIFLSGKGEVGFPLSRESNPGNPILIQGGNYVFHAGNTGLTLDQI